MVGVFGQQYQTMHTRTPCSMAGVSGSSTLSATSPPLVPSMAENITSINTSITKKNATNTASFQSWRCYESVLCKENTRAVYT